MARLFLSIVFILYGGMATSQKKHLNVAIAASLTKPFEEIESAFEKIYGIEINLISGSSGMLATQIRNNAPFDIFISANRDFSEGLLKEKLVSSAVPFCRGQIVWWCKENIALETISQSIKNKKIRTIAIANPELAPYGTAGLAWLNENAEIKAVQLLYGENIGSVNRYIYSKSVDGAITSLSSMYAPEIKNIGYWFPIETELDMQLVNVISIVKVNPDAEAFLRFILSEKVTTILENYGYLSVK